jgi:uncharacterized membrane protein
MTRKVLILEFSIVVAALAVTLVAWPHLPALVPTHWNGHLQPDGYSPRWSLFGFGPGFMAGVTLLTWLLPWLSPKHFEVENFRATYRQIMLILFGLMTYLYAVMVWAAFGHAIDAGRTIMGGVCLFLALIGNLLGKVRRNFYIGLRTPWTLANERVWNASHRFAAKTCVAGGLLGLLFCIAGLQNWALYSILAAALASVMFSLVYYKQLERRGEL